MGAAEFRRLLPDGGSPISRNERSDSDGGGLLGSGSGGRLEWGKFDREDDAGGRGDEVDFALGLELEVADGFRECLLLLDCDAVDWSSVTLW
ncbi:hypothetical protein ACKVWC_000923 [Pyricularia oryzae]